MIRTLSADTLAGAVCCTLFSLSGMVFLFGLSAALKSDSIYFLMEVANEENPKHSFASAVDTAIYLYLSTLLLSLLFWIRTYTADSIVEKR